MEIGHRILFFFMYQLLGVLLSIDDNGKKKAKKYQINFLCLMPENLLIFLPNVTFQIKCWKSGTISEEKCESTFEARSIYYLTPFCMYVSLSEAMILWRTHGSLIQSVNLGQILFTDTNWVTLRKSLSLFVPQLAVMKRHFYNDCAIHSSSTKQPRIVCF